MLKKKLNSITINIMKEVYSNRKLLQKTKKMWVDAPFYSGTVLSTNSNLNKPIDAEVFCFQWVRISRQKRLDKHRRQRQNQQKKKT